ncbi:MAG TPA: DUF4386 family protein [Candidatus Sulfotelmatobacter sp.]|nr:DUF4386 family protein [Candidatus Sulfotelmatobacter sp.]
MAFEIDLIFFGFWTVLAGYLIVRSTFMARILGALLMLDGIGWAMYLWPPLATFVFPAIAVASGLAEVPLQFWLIVFGLNPQRWREQARAAGIFRLTASRTARLAAYAVETWLPPARVVLA